MRKVVWTIVLSICLIFVVQAMSNLRHLFESKPTDPTAVRADGSKQDPMDAVLIIDGSGRNQFIGNEIVAGFRTALRDDKLKSDIRMVIRDSRGTPEAAAALADGSAAGNRTLVIVGPTEAQSVPAFLQSAKEGEVAAVLPIGTPLRERHSRWSFSLQPPVFKQGQLLGKFLQRTVKDGRVARLIVEDAPPDGLWSGMLESYKDVGDEKLELITWKSGLSKLGARNAISNHLFFDAIIISLPMADATNVVRELRFFGYAGLIVVEGEASIPDFANQFADEPKEILKPGYFTDGLLSLAPFLPTIASEKSQRLITTYRQAHATDPSWAYAYGYDAGLLIADFIQRARAAGNFNLSNPDMLRTNFRSYLAGLQSQVDPLFGFTGQIKFGANNQRNQSPKLFVFRNKLQSPYFEQLADEPTLVLDSASNEESISIGDERYIVIPVVYTGVMVKRVDNIDFDTKTFDLTFDISFKSREPFNIENVLFTNMVSQKAAPHLLEDRSEGRAVFRRYRVSGKFAFSPVSADMVLDRTTINLSWRDRTRDSNAMRFVIDPDYSEAAYRSLEQKMEAGQGLSASGFAVISDRFGVDDEVVAEPGDPRSIGGVGKFSTVTFQADLARQVSTLTSKFINSIGVERMQITFAAVSIAFLAFSIWQIFNSTPIGAIAWWLIFAVTCFFSKATLFTSTEQIEFLSTSLVWIRYGFELAFTLATVRILDVVFTQWKANRGQSADALPVINFLIRSGLYFAGVSYYYTVVLERDLLPILATFSVMLTVFGLAMREMIFDAIAGVAIAADGQIAVGQWVNIRARDRHIHGVVQTIGWRYLAVRSRDEQVHFIPNSIVATQILSNLSLGGGYARCEIPFVMAAGKNVSEVLPIVTQAVEESLLGNSFVDRRRRIKVVVSNLEDKRLRCVVQIYYSPSESLDELRTIVLKAVQEVLSDHGAFAVTYGSLPAPIG